MKEKALQSLKVKVFLLLLIPAIGLFYFSSSYVYDNYLQYNKALDLNRAQTYVKKTLLLIHSLQQERGYGAAYLSDDRFYEKFQQTISRSKKLEREYREYIKNNSFINLDFKKILQSLSHLDTLRENIKIKKISLLEEVQTYSNIIASLIDSTTILERDFALDEIFFRYIRTFNLVLKVTEFNGQERALISYLLSQNRFDMQILKYLIFVDVKEKATRELLDKEIPYQLLIEFQKILSYKEKKEFFELKEKIIYGKNFSLISKDEWWEKITNFIDKLFALEYEILHKLQSLQKELRNKTINALIISLIIWFFTFVALIWFLKIFNNIISDIVFYLNKLDIESRFYRTISEFSENALFAKTPNTLINDFALLLYKTEFFEFLYVQECKNDNVVISENLSLSFIKEKMPSNVQRAIKKAKENISYQVIYSPECSRANAFGVFPIFSEKSCRFILVVAMKLQYHLDEQLIDLIYKMIEILDFALQKITLEREEEKLKEELKLLSYTFNANEAITITDANGKILRVNKAFEKITGYKEEEVIGKNPSILKSGKHDKDFYQKMWEEIKSKGFWKGEIYNKRKDGTIYPEILAISAIKNEEGEITNYIAHFFDISELKKAQEEIAYRAHYDILTNVINRQTLLEELNVLRKRALRQGSLCAFFFIDVDNFKYINDTYGHSIGDKVLIKVADILQSLAKEDDVVARIAGDEFGFVMVDAGRDVDEATKKATILAQKILEHAAKPLSIGDLKIYIGFSIGIYIFPIRERSAEEILLNADLAMYHSKKNGKNSFTFFNEEIDIASKQFLVKKKELEEGLEENRFLLHYQPKVSLERGEVIAFEALLRFRRKNGDLLYPEKFLPYASGNKILYSLTEFVLKESLKTLEEWEEFQGYISINLAVELFLNSNFMEEFYRWLDHPKSSHIRIELLEDSFIKDIHYAKKHLGKLNELGIECAIDDFGVGYSSLHLLKVLPLKEIKIDRSFIVDFFSDKNNEIVTKMVEIAKLFDYEVTAEGVESSEVLRSIKSIGCDFFQGFLFSRAVSKDQARKFFENSYSKSTQRTDQNSS